MRMLGFLWFNHVTAEPIWLKLGINIVRGPGIAYYRFFISEYHASEAVGFTFATFANQRDVIIFGYHFNLKLHCPL